MNKTPLLILILLLALVLVACAPSEAAIQTAIAQTAEVSTRDAPTSTPEPSRTPTPAATATPTHCAAQDPDYFASVDDLLAEWEDVESVAGTTPRVSLNGPIQNMQAIRREAAGLQPPDCADAMQTLLVDYMQDVIDAFLDFATEKPDTIIELNFLITAIKEEGVQSYLKVARGELSEMPHRVHYVVFSIDLVRVEYTDTEGEQEDRQPSPWVYTFLAEEDTPLSVIASTNTGSFVQCEIYLDGEQLAFTTNNNSEDGAATCQP